MSLIIMSFLILDETAPFAKANDSLVPLVPSGGSFCYSAFTLACHLSNTECLGDQTYKALMS